VTISGKLQADQSPADEDSSIVVDSQSKCIGADEAEELVERNYAAVYRYAYRLAGCAATAEDITQDVFMKAIGHLRQLRSGAAERSWLLTITRREFMRWLRQIARPALGRPGPLDEEALLDADRSPGADAPPLDNEDWVQAALSQLNEDARVALLMYYFEDLSYAEIAQQLQIPIGTVMSRLSRGREHLRQGLERLARPQSTTSSPSVNSTPANGDRPAPATLHTHVIGSQSESKPPAQEAQHG
jgi:RNA polymerase sigma-70 factor (ECF subfamily)